MLFGAESYDTVKKADTVNLYIIIRKKTKNAKKR